VGTKKLATILPPWMGNFSGRVRESNPSIRVLILRALVSTSKQKNGLYGYLKENMVAVTSAYYVVEYEQAHFYFKQSCGEETGVVSGNW